MKPTACLRPIVAAVCAVLLLAPLDAFPQNAMAAKPAPHGVVPGDMDRSVKPGDDFFEYSVGGWVKRTEIPADRAAYSPDAMLQTLTNKQTVDLIQQAAKSNAPAGSNSRKIADLYESYMNESAVESRGLVPLRPYLDAIAAVQNKDQLAYVLGQTLRSDVDALNNTNFHTDNLFGLWVAPAFHDPQHYTAYLMQGGGEMPDREYYLSNGGAMRKIRDAYLTHVAAMMKLGGFSDADARAKRVVDLEHAIAEKQTSLEEDQDILKADNTWSRADFSAKAPGLNWSEYFRGAGLSQQASFIVWQPGAFTGESALVTSAPLEAWKDWLAYHLIETTSVVLPKALADEDFAFFEKTLTGVQAQRPRWQDGAQLVDTLLGYAVGQLYAQKYFPPESKARVQAMVANIIEAFRKRIDALTWMDPATKAEAKAKLTNIYVGVGYPDTWEDYSAYEVKRDDLFGNVWNGAFFDYRRDLGRLGKPVDRKEWFMLPQTVNAMNLPLHNALQFPAAYLQAPNFEPLASDAFNYGSIGGTLGHEISHTFDDEGSSFDSEGRLRNWWTAADLKHFQEAAAKLAAQFDQYRPFPDLAVNGKQTIGENIADVAGLAAAYDAWKVSLGGTAAPMVDGLTGDQQFFLGYGQSWAHKEREAQLRHQLMTDVHAPARYRADTVRNLSQWYPAFEVEPGDKLYLAPADRVTVW
jgi:putative endopeptidase